MHPRLSWASLFENCLSSALDGGVRVGIENHVDPLRKILWIFLAYPLPKGCWNSLQTLAHAYAIANDCMIKKITKIGERSYAVDLSMKSRVKSREMANDPFTMDEWTSGAQRRKEQYIKKLRDKAAEEEELLAKERSPYVPPFQIDGKKF